VKALIVILVALCTLWGCSKAPAPAQQATVTLNDGSTFSGAVTSSSSSAISLQSSSGEARTYPMSQVASVQYAAPAPATAAAPPPVDAAAPQPAPIPQPVAQPAPQPVVEFRTIPAGATIAVRNNDTIDSQTAQAGQTFPGVVERDVLDNNGRVAIPRGSNATLVVRSAEGQGKLQGQSDLAVDVSSVVVGGRTYRLETSDFVEKGKQGLGTNKRTGEFVGGGAALGGIIGAIAGGGKGAAIGGLAGAGAGTATQGITRGHAVRIPAETLIRFKLEAPVRIRELR
jgi:hypothetical protein